MNILLPTATVDSLPKPSWLAESEKLWSPWKLEGAGVDIIQFDEPAFNVFFEDVRDGGVEVLELAAEGLRAETVVHICYGYGIKANTDWKATLGPECRQYEQSVPLL